jgi:hypothetical protein
MVRTQHGVTASVGQRCGDVEIRNYLRDQAGSRSLVFDLSITHPLWEKQPPLAQLALDTPAGHQRASAHSAQRKINCYRQQYADNQNISFLPAITSTVTRTAIFCVFFFYRPTGRPRRTSLPLACHRNATIRTCSVSSARNSSSR